LTLGISLAVAVAFALGGRSLFARITDDGPVLEAAVRFARPIFFGAPVIAVCLTISNLLRSEKRVKEAAIMLLVSSAVNAVLNPVLIHGRFGAPAMGVAGAGVATVLGFLVSAVLGLAYLRGGRLSLGPAAWRIDRGIDRRDVRAILRIALPTLGSYAATICVLMMLSVIWARFGTEALASYGLATRLEYLLAVVIYGIGSAILTLGGEAWGAGRDRELVRICWIAAGCVVAATSLLAVILMVAPATWFELFGASPGVVDSGARYLQIAALSYPFYALALTLNYGYQTLSRAHLPLLWSLLRGFAIAVPVAAAVAAPGGSIATAAAGVAASLVVLGAITAWWLPRSIARMRGGSARSRAGPPRAPARPPRPRSRRRPPGRAPAARCTRSPRRA
jgi:putative MATE family efflux protein